MGVNILLPGNGVHNKEWIEDIQKVLGGMIQVYRHWKNGEAMIDFAHEARVLSETVSNQPVRVFAKSAGCLVAMKAVREFGVQIERAVFVGTAVEWGEVQGLPVRSWLQDWHVPTLFVHKQQDPVIALQDLKGSLPPSSQLVELPGADHDYLELDSFIPAVKAFLENR